MSEIAREMDVADFVAERMKQDPKIQRVVADAHLFDDLRRDPGWKRLYERVVADKRRIMEGVATRLLAGEKVTQEEIEFYRGFYQGAVFVLQHPEHAERNLERAARVAWLLVQSEVAAEAEEDSPYITGPTIPEEG